MANLEAVLRFAVRAVPGRTYRAFARHWVERAQVYAPDEPLRDPTGEPVHSATFSATMYATTYPEDYAAGNAAIACRVYGFNDWYTAALLAGRAVAQGRVYGAEVRPRHAYDLRSAYIPVAAAVVAEQLAVLRCLAGNPFRTPVVRPAWVTSTVVGLVRGINADAAFDRLPILADALEDAGCDSADLLAHLRGDGPHVRGCWALDLVLGKS
jgi:hypothetical protein